MTGTTRTEHPETQTPPGASWPNERARLLHGLLAHLMVFVVAMSAAILLNWVTHDPGEAWWFIWIFAVWALAWAIHLFGVGVQFSSHRSDG